MERRLKAIANRRFKNRKSGEAPPATREETAPGPSGDAPGGRERSADVEASGPTLLSENSMNDRSHQIPRTARAIAVGPVGSAESSREPVVPSYPTLQSLQSSRVASSPSDVCEVCQSIPLDRLPSDYGRALPHHTWADLNASASNCQLC